MRQDRGTQRYYTRVTIRVGKKKVYVRSPNRSTREEAEADGLRLGAAQTLEEAYATQAALAGESAKTSTGVTEKDGTFWGFVWKREKKKTSVQVRGPPRATEAEALKDRAALVVATGVAAAREIAARLKASSAAAAASAGSPARSNVEQHRSGFRASVHRHCGQEYE